MTETVKTGRRIDSIDILRAFGILIMIMGHVGFGGKFDRYIHTFHMPIFFLISGFLYKSKTETNVFILIAQKARRLLIPYVFYAVINYIVWLILNYGNGGDLLSPLRRLVTYNTEGLPISGALWFLTAIFFTEVLYLIIDRIIGIQTLRSVVVMAAAVGSSFAFNRSEGRLPLTIDIALVCIGFYEIGRLYKLYRNRIIEALWARKFIFIFVAFAVFLANGALAFVNDYVNIKSGWYGNIPLFWINAVLGSLAYHFVAVFADRILKKEGCIRRFLVGIGSTSMIFLGLNQLVILLVNILFDYCSFAAGYFIREMLVLVVTVVVLYMCSFIVRKINNKYISILMGI